MKDVVRQKNGRGCQKGQFCMHEFQIQEKYLCADKYVLNLSREIEGH